MLGTSNGNELSFSVQGEDTVLNSDANCCLRDRRRSKLMMVVGKKIFGKRIGVYITVQRSDGAKPYGEVVCLGIVITGSEHGMVVSFW